MTSPSWPDRILSGHLPRWSDIPLAADAVLETCSMLEISGLVHDRLIRSGGTNDWPDRVNTELDRRARLATARELVRVREIRTILDALAAHGIVPILLKGAALAQLVYDSPSLRPRLDTDFLFAREHVAIVRRVFTDRGYVQPPMADGELVFCQFQMVNTDAFGIAHVFDVHWKISTQTVFADLLTYDELRAQAVEVPGLGPHARAAIGVHALLLACVHPVMHHRHADRLIWLYDIDRVVRRLSGTELLAFAELAVNKGVAAICARQLSVVIARFGTPVSSDALARLASAAKSERSATYLRPNRRWHHEFLWNLQSLGGWRDRVRLLREVLFPNPQYMLEAYGVRFAGPFVLPALYVHRCAYGAFKILIGRK